jgi:hypothetical protein
MNKKIESSDRDKNIMTLWPQHLLCMKCLNGGGKLDFMELHNLAEKLRIIKDNPDIHIRLEGAFDEIGARTAIFDQQTPEERKRDLDVLQKLGLTTGDTRTARDLYKLIDERIPNLLDICVYPTEYQDVWIECPLARTDKYQKGTPAVTKKRSAEESESVKISSCKEIGLADHIVIRAHHLLCIICFIGREDNSKPIPQDNLYEVWMKIRNNPEIPVTVVEGASECSICPPCPFYDPTRGLCIADCHLRDRKKDLDTMLKLGIKSGDTLPAKELIARIYKNIPEVKGLCSFESITSPEWSGCGIALIGQYESGLKKGVF